MIGFDGSADDVFVVVLHRGPDGRWQIDTADGPDPGQAADWAAEWLAAYAGETFELTPEQRAMLADAYEPAEGTSWWTTTART